MTAPAPFTIGLLPFYLKLYDDIFPGLRSGFDDFQRRLVKAFERRSIAVVASPPCCVRDEFAAVIRQFETAGVDAIVTVHLAYSPSLEALEPFTQTRLPVLICDTTMDAAFGRDVLPERILYNHGVHGVMDFASVLRRHRRPFEIAAGHLDDPHLLERLIHLLPAARAATSFLGSRVLRVGPEFAGMGDFSVPAPLLYKRFGIEAQTRPLEALEQAMAAISDAEVDVEMTGDMQRYDCALDGEVHRRSTRVGLGLRRLLTETESMAVSVNFQAFDQPNRLANTMPFLEASKGMARGIGYAGEGDMLTAALVGALARGFGDVTFTEIFCPDWAGGSLFLSHMGEISPAVAADRPRLVAKPSLLRGGLSTAVLTCAVRPGPAAFVNLAPGPDESFSLIAAPVEVLPEENRLAPAMRDSIRAWIRPRLPVSTFLESYSRAGGTHHNALVLGEAMEAIAAFGRMTGLAVVRLE